MDQGTQPESLPIQASAMAPHVEHLRFQDFASFQDHMGRTHLQWDAQVRQTLRLMALHGIVDPFSELPIAAGSLRLAGSNYRESFEYEGCLSRHRALLLLLRSLQIAENIPPQSQLEIFCPEAITPFARTLASLYPKLQASEFLPDPHDPRRQQLVHQDICKLRFADNSLDMVVCSELFEHLYDLPMALREIARVLRPEGYLLATFPFAYNRFDSIVKARHRPGARPGFAEEAELLAECEYHGDPVYPERGSLVYQIPGWEVLDQARDSGLRNPAIHWIAAPSYGIVGQELPAVLVMVARGR